MGCDIHFVLEKKDVDRGRWVGVRYYGHFKATLLTSEHMAVDGSFIRE